MDGAVFVWGRNFDGQLGVDDVAMPMSYDSPQPLAPPLDTAIAAIAAGALHSLALSASGQVFGCSNDQMWTRAYADVDPILGRCGPDSGQT